MNSNSNLLNNLLSTENEPIIQTPLVRRNISHLRQTECNQIDTELTSSEQKRQGTSGRSLSSGNKILVENTPTPFLLRKFQKTAQFEVDGEDNDADGDHFDENSAPILKKKSAHKIQRIIPNTPVVNRLQQTNQSINTKRVEFI